MAKVVGIYPAPPAPRGARRVWRSVGVLASIVVLVLAVVFVLTAGRVIQNGRTDEARPADVILVLGAAQFDGRPQPYLLARLEHAKSLYDQGIAPRIVTLGGRREGDRFTEAEASRNWLVDHGVPTRSIEPVGQGANTLQSLRAAAVVLKDNGWQSAVLVTDPWHELRSTTMLSDQGIASFGSPTTSGPSVSGGLVLKARYVIRETAAYLDYVTLRVFS